MNRFCLGDVHGGYRALTQVLQSSGIDYNKDLLICLGDTCDSWPDTPLCFEELLKIKNLVYIIGNHDSWTQQYLKFGLTPQIWTSQGGRATLNAYINLLQNGEEEQLQRHLVLLESGVYYHELDNMLFVHGGFNWHHPIAGQSPYDLMWDRDLITVAGYWQGRIDKGVADDTERVQDYDEVFIGHTPTSRIAPDLKPVKLSNVWCLDQGARWEGKLTLMNIDTYEYFQSDIVSTLYPGEHGRK
ncbi:MAG TPA: metallophosphoesterase [archaeon]|nr:metallophosphoesterase [archaeon]